MMKYVDEKEVFAEIQPWLSASVAVPFIALAVIANTFGQMWASR